MATKPNFDVFYKMGCEASRYLDPDYTYQEIADRMGEELHTVRVLCMVALGKLIYHLRKMNA